MKTIFAILSLVVLTSCGGYEAATPGVFGESEREDEILKSSDLESIFRDLKICVKTELLKAGSVPDSFSIPGEFSELSIQGVKDPFQCVGKLRIGCFYSPNQIILTIYNPQITQQVFRHESIHYMLLIMNGNLDPEHVSDLFLDCI